MSPVEKIGLKGAGLPGDVFIIREFRTPMQLSIIPDFYVRWLICCFFYKGKKNDHTYQQQHTTMFFFFSLLMLSLHVTRQKNGRLTLMIRK